MIRLALLLLVLALPASAGEIVVTFGGDVNFARSHSAPVPDALRKFRAWPLDHATEALAREWTGDINFVNVETVVSDRDGYVQGKTFVFRSHPEQMRHLMDLGVNAFSLANNHSYDHGLPGMEATLSFFEGEARERNILFAGLGRGEASTAPKVGMFAGVRVAMSAIGIGPGWSRSGPWKVGMANWRAPGDYAAVLRGLAEARADLKILSIHQGIENQIALEWGSRDAFRRAVEEAGGHLVLGHHPHIVRAVEAEPERGTAIFHSLGNLLFAGGAVRDGLPVGHDYGLLGKAYFAIDAQGVRLTALEAVPLTGVHAAARPMGPVRLGATLRHLNAISRAAAGSDAAEFSPLGDRGAACFGEPYGPRAGRLCCRVSRTMSCDLPDLM